MQPVIDAIGPRWVRIKDAGPAEHGYEITCWNKSGRTFVCLCLNPEIVGTSTGGGNAAKLRSEERRVTLQFRAPAAGVRNERMDTSLGEGNEFQVDWKLNEAVILSFDSVLHS